MRVAADWPRRSATATTGSTDDTPRRAGESLRVLDDGHRPSGVVESREKDLLSHELQGDRLLTPSRLEKKTAINQRERIGTSRSEPAAQTAKALVDRQVRFPAAPQRKCWSEQ